MVWFIGFIAESASLSLMDMLWIARSTGHLHSFLWVGGTGPGCMMVRDTKDMATGVSLGGTDGNT